MNEIRNARDPEQVRRMQILLDNNLCFFCFEGKEHGVAPEILRAFSFWYITPNRYPLDGAIHHYMIVPERHITHLEQIEPRESMELFTMVIPWLTSHLQVTSYSTFIRCGDAKITGGTLKHLHIQFIVGGEKPDDFEYPRDVVPVVIAFKNR